MLKGGKSPHSRRMAAFKRDFPPPHDPLTAAHFERIGQMDLRARAGFEEFKQRLFSLRVASIEGGSGFRMAHILRYFWGECAGRLGQHGPGFFPSSFNVVEAFVNAG
jgi:hypothetical protein